MKRLLPLLICLLSCAASAAPVKLIFDTDMGNDVDDLIALCLIHSLQKRGACGLAAPFPHSAIERDLDYLPHHPLKEAYYLHSPPPHDRPTWDPATVLYAVFADRGYFDLSPPGKVEVGADGGTVFHPAKGGGGRHRYLLMSSIQAARVQEAIVQLSVEPPSPAKAR